MLTDLFFEVNCSHVDNTVDLILEPRGHTHPCVECFVVNLLFTDAPTEELWNNLNHLHRDIELPVRHDIVTGLRELCCGKCIYRLLNG